MAPSRHLVMMKMGFCDLTYRSVLNYLSVINCLLMTVELKFRWEWHGSDIPSTQMTVEWKFSFKQSVTSTQSTTETAYKENVLVAARKLAESFPSKKKNKASPEL